MCHCPLSFGLINRPTYTNPDSIENYMKVLELRDIELEYVIDSIYNEISNYIDIEVILFGNSEGGRSVMEYSKREDFIDKKIVMSYAYEENYYNKINPEKIINSKIPILNIIGSEDEYFGINSYLHNNNNKIIGNSTKTLSKYNDFKMKNII